MGVAVVVEEQTPRRSLLCLELRFNAGVDGAW